MYRSKRSTYRSRFEYRLAKECCERATYETHVLTYHVEHKYTPDFVLPNGIVIEAKGYFTPADRGKMLTVKKQYPHLDIRFVFMANNKLSKRSKTTYGAWCEQHGFPYAFTTIPEAWYKEPKGKRTLKGLKERGK